MSEEMYRPGLEGVIAGETEICSVEQGTLIYRGYAIHDLAEHSCFEETAYLLLHGELPDARQLQDFKALLDQYRPLPEAVIETLRRIPRKTAGMDVLRTAVSAAGHFDPVEGDEPEDWHKRAIFLTAQIGGIIAARQRLIKGQEPVPHKEGLSHAAQILYQLRGEEPEQDSTALLDLTLVLYAEHEFNASTFVSRICSSTLSDLTSCIVAGIGTLKGPLHGGANEAAIEMLRQFKTADEARQWTLDAIQAKSKIMGFGHRVYKHGDHRAKILEARMRSLGQKLGQDNWLDIYDAVKTTMDEQKGIFPNVDYPCGLTYYLLKLPIEVYTPLFVASRVVGWSAHATEQHFHNRLIRPRSKYTGPAQRPFVVLADRA